MNTTREEATAIRDALTEAIAASAERYIPAPGDLFRIRYGDYESPVLWAVSSMLRIDHAGYREQMDDPYIPDPVLAIDTQDHTLLWCTTRTEGDGTPINAFVPVEEGEGS